MMDLHREIDVQHGEMFLVNKPRDWSSFDVVNKMRSIFHIEKIGHAGTLDKNATGLLIICTGKMTKELSTFQGLDKEYEVTMRLGEHTASYDSETPVLETKETSHLSREEIESAIGTFVGRQEQLPPMWSAAKVGGKRLYAYARKGVEVQRNAREICISSINIRGIDLPDIDLTVVCSKGTYIRTLVNDIGNSLGVGAHVLTLTRTRVGNFLLADAVTIDELISLRKVHRN